MLMTKVIQFLISHASKPLIVFHQMPSVCKQNHGDLVTVSQKYFLVHVCFPLLGVLKCRFVGDIKDNYCRLCVLGICRLQTYISLLSCNVPELYIEQRIFHTHSFESIVDTKRGRVMLIICFVYVSLYDSCLSRVCVAYDEYLCDCAFLATLVVSSANTRTESICVYVYSTVCVRVCIAIYIIVVRNNYSRTHSTVARKTPVANRHFFFFFCLLCVFFSVEYYTF